MKRKRNKFSRGIVPVPSLLIALGWLAIWLVWPMGVTSLRGVESPSTVSVLDASELEGSLYRPDIFLPSANGFNVHGDQSGTVDMLSERKYLPPRLLTRDEAVPVVPDNTSALRPSMADEEPYVPAFQDQPLFDKLSADGLHLLTAVRGNLSDCGFKIPDLAAVLEGKTDRPWIVEIHVDLGSDGRVNHAFLMTGSQDAELNAKLVRRMHFAEAMAVDRECSGRVVISCGRR
ncbi:MAG: hypothetical protein QGI24_09615 [Kiritimatiellia bacterium]|jgi:hypothetical protein|nr:hypothetical protein [Kiritimatiellia bacterium]MDP6849032.1 hypothetical protein [Kiritimatiellia bacterium]